MVDLAETRTDQSPEDLDNMVPAARFELATP
jgi:hypothetical protein